MDTKNLADLYDLPPVPWQQVKDELDAGLDRARPADRPTTQWLATTNPDGSTHLTGVGALWFDDAFWFTSGLGARKAQNALRTGRCSIAVPLPGLDLAVDGDVTLVDDPGQVAAAVQRYADGGWPATVDEPGTAVTAPFSAPSAGPPPWRVFRVVPREVTVVLSEEPGGATRFRL
ncbi:pyridoxamine 5'-phosphate oxidase family protein [Angustibacter peucedani]